MKKLLTLLTGLLLLPTVVEAQNNNPEFWWGLQTYTQDKNGGPIEKGDTVYLEVKINPHGSNIRSTYFDFQHQKDAVHFLGVERREAIPSQNTFLVHNWFYPNCKFNRTSSNVTTVGWTNWMNANYTCNASQVPHTAINRVYTSVAGNQNLTNIATYIRLKFEITNTDAGFPYDSVYMNFAIGVSGDHFGNGGNSWLQGTTNSGPKGTWIQLASTENNLITGQLKHSGNTSSGAKDKMSLRVYNASDNLVLQHAIGTGNGSFSFAQVLNQNSDYTFKLHTSDVDALLGEAITISDYTAAVTEFITQNLDGTYNNNNIDHGMKYWAADINNDSTFDAPDLQALFNHVVGVDTIDAAPNGYLPIFPTSEYDGTTLTSWKSIKESGRVLTTTDGGQVEWVVLYPYDNTNKRYRIGLDSREFPTGGPAWDALTHLQLFDLYQGAIVPKSTGTGTAYWNEYWIYTDDQIDFSDTNYNAYIRDTGGGGYAFKAELSFTQSNLREIPFVTTTATQQVAWNYGIKGDVNLSHSSPLTTSGVTNQSQARLVQTDPSIDLNLNNVIVTSDSLTIPFEINSRNIPVSALQFEVQYDQTKLKFEELDANTPSWITFVNDSDGTLRFGGLAEWHTNSADHLITGQATPFTLKFSSIGSGTDLNSNILLTRNLDVADGTGHQVGMNINTNLIKLIGVNNFTGS